ncbi:MAG: hypothetical protein AB1765_02260 [Candidatus Hydrogenedentota bacterium]
MNNKKVIEYKDKSNGYVTKGDLAEALIKIDKRFELLQQDMDKRFEEVDKRFVLMQQDMDKRFEQVDKRFEQVDKRFDILTKKIDDSISWTQAVVGGFQMKAGRNLEDTIAGTIRLAMGITDIDASNLKLRQKIIDTGGEIGPKGRRYEFDILLYNGTSYVFEIKSTPDVENIERFLDKYKMVVKKLRLRKPKAVMITLVKDPYITQLCKRRNILLV